MNARRDRVGDIVEGARRRSRSIVTPEGVPLDVKIANPGERLTAFALDMLFMALATACLYAMFALVLTSGINIAFGITLIMFAAFVVRNMYFIHFELAWQGRTPGKRICGLRVIDRGGGELTPSAVIARNLTREVELFLPLSLIFNSGMAEWRSMALISWTVVVAMIPIFTRDRLRLGDLIGGTQVIAMPKRVLLGDLSMEQDNKKADEAATEYVFTHEQLGVYGAFELQVLEEFLRRPQSPAGDRQLEEICGKITKKIGWDGTIPPRNARKFLSDFYTAERADLERGKLFGKMREDKGSATEDKK